MEEQKNANDNMLAALEPLEPLDLRKRKTIGAILEGYEKCSFGARNTGEVAHTITHWIQDGRRKPVVIFEDEPDTRLGQLLRHMYFEKKWLRGIYTLREYAACVHSDDRVIVVGEYLKREAKPIYELPDEQVIFINPYEMAKPGKVRDGYFPNVIFSDPTFIVPLIFWALRERLDGEKISTRRFIDDLNEYQYGGLGNDVAHGAYTWRAMKKAGCRMFVTISGAMTVAQMSLLICDMIDLGLAHYISATGALMAHGLVHSLGLKHYKYNPAVSDTILAAHKLNRVSDTLEDEKNFDHVEDVFSRVFKAWPAEVPLGVIRLHELVGQYLTDHFPDQRGILKSAYAKAVLINVPAFVDSEIGNDKFLYNLWCKYHGKEKIRFDQDEDTKHLLSLLSSSVHNGIINFGGGVPRNNTRNGLPLIELMNVRLKECKGYLPVPQHLFKYSVRIDPAALHIGGMSGSTEEEGISWRKMDPKGTFATMRTDATIAGPIILKFMMETAL